MNFWFQSYGSSPVAQSQKKRADGSIRRPRSGFQVRLKLCVLVGVVLASFVGMVRGVAVVRMCYMRMAAGFFMRGVAGATLEDTISK